MPSSVFGSMAEGRAREDSGVDLAVAGLPPEKFFATMARLTDLFGPGRGSGGSR